MNNVVRLTRFFNADKNEVFKYFVRPQLIEQWSAPIGMTLKVPKFEARVGGSYRYEHTGKDGIYICDGYLTEFVPNERLATRDSVKGPDGQMLFHNLEGTVVFKGVAAGTEVTVIQRGFPDEVSASECERGWTECLNQLQGLVEKTASPRDRDRGLLLDEGQASL